MTRKWLPTCLLSALALTALLSMPSLSSAQFRGGRGVGRGYGSYAPGYGGYYPGYGGYYPGYSGYYSPGSSYYPGTSYYNAQPYSYGYNSGYLPNSSYYNWNTQPSYYGNRQAEYRSFYPNAAAGTAADGSVLINIHVPANAELWIGEQEMLNQSGPQRQFRSPPLTAGKEYSYELTARWTDAAGREVVRKRTLNFQAGTQQRLDVDFMAPTS